MTIGETHRRVYLASLGCIHVLMWFSVAELLSPSCVRSCVRAFVRSDPVHARVFVATQIRAMLDPFLLFCFCFSFVILNAKREFVYVCVWGCVSVVSE